MAVTAEIQPTPGPTRPGQPSGPDPAGKVSVPAWRRPGIARRFLLAAILLGLFLQVICGTALVLFYLQRQDTRQIQEIELPLLAAAQRLITDLGELNALALEMALAEGEAELRTGKDRFDSRRRSVAEHLAFLENNMAPDLLAPVRRLLDDMDGNVKGLVDDVLAQAASRRRLDLLVHEIRDMELRARDESAADALFRRAVNLMLLAAAAGNGPQFEQARQDYQALTRGLDPGSSLAARLALAADPREGVFVVKAVWLDASGRIKNRLRRQQGQASSLLTLTAALESRAAARLTERRQRASRLAMWLGASLIGGLAGSLGVVLFLYRFVGTSLVGRLTRLKNDMVNWETAGSVQTAPADGDELDAMTNALAEVISALAEKNRDLSLLNAELSAHLAALERTRGQLAENERKLSAIINAASEAIVMVDRAGWAMHWNQAAEHMFGCVGERTDRVRVKAFLAPPDRRRLARAMAATTADTQRGHDPAPTLEAMAARADRGVFPVDISLAPVRFEGRPHCLAVIRDITERRRFEALRRDVDRIVAHDLKSPLNAIVGLPDMLLQDRQGLPEEVTTALGMIRDAGWRMLRLINLSLDLYRMETGTYAADPVPIDLVPLFQRVAAENMILVKAQDLSLAVSLDGRPVGERDAYWVLGEEILCHALFANLLKNACEASPRGGRVDIRLFREDPRRIELANHGAAPEPIRERFFEKYATHGKKGGSGLGAYSARLMARTMGGDITLATSEEAGTTLTVLLPAPPEPALAPPPAGPADLSGPFEAPAL